MSRAPTREQVKNVWEGTPNPTVRSIAEIMQAAGFKISFRTVARWKEQGWREDIQKDGSVPLREKAKRKPPALRLVMQNEIAKIPAETVAEADKIAATGEIQLTDLDLNRIDKRIKALAPKKAEDLMELQDRTRTIMNIVLMEEAMRKANVLVLMPKDVGSFVNDVALASKANAFTMPIEAPPQAQMVEVQHSKALSPMSEAIRRVREKADL
jgi:hypothetical protein